MACEYTIDRARRLVETHASGVVTFAELKGHQERLIADPDFDPAFDQLVDTTEVTSFSLSAREAEIIASRRNFSPSSLRALVAVRPEIFGLARLMEVHHRIWTGAEHTGVLRSRDAAEEWLVTVRKRAD